MQIYTEFAQKYSILTSLDLYISFIVNLVNKLDKFDVF